MNIDQYINWIEIWEKEISIQSSIDILDESNTKLSELLNHFKEEKSAWLCLMPDECSITEAGNLLFVFGESGGKSEGDPEGWSRDYTFTVDEDFTIIDGEHQQG